MAAQTSVGLVMIVRNESAILARLAQSVISQIDHWTIVDTGSTDDTVAVARAAFASLPGEVIEDTWRGFGPSRTVAMRAAEPHTSWMLTLDADDAFVGSIDRDLLLSSDIDAVDAEYRFANLRYWVPRLVRSGRGWHWRGRAHEYLTLPTGIGRRQRTDAFWVEHQADGGNRATKAEREISLLRQDWAESPGDPRTAFYLARSFEDFGRAEDAITWYRRRLKVPGWVEEAWYAKWRLGLCLLAVGSVDEGCGALWAAWGERPWRPEPLASLAEHYRGVNAWELAWNATQLAFSHCPVAPDGAAPPSAPDSLFVNADVPAWRIAYEASISAWYVGEKERGRQLSQFLLDLSELPTAIREAVAANMSFYEKGDDSG